MSDFADVEQFGREHGDCGGIQPSAAPQPGGGFFLTLTCACGATLDRMVSIEEAKRPLPLPRAATRPAPRPAPPPSADVEAALRAAIDAETAAPPAPAPREAPARRETQPAPSRPDLDAVMREALAAESQPAAPPPAPPRATAPAKLNLDTTIRTALDAQAALVKGRTAAPAAPRTRIVLLIVFSALLLGGAGVLYFAGAPATTRPAAPAASAPPPPLPLDQQQRAALDETVKSLRQLQAASSPATSLSVYSSRVVFAKTDVERFAAATAPGPERAAVREVLDIHMLAAAAWKARTVDQKDAWEAVGQDPAIELCPSVKRVVDFATTPENASRAQARGAAVASAIPLLWECAAARLAALEHGPAGD